MASYQVSYIIPSHKQINSEKLRNILFIYGKLTIRYKFINF